MTDTATKILCEWLDQQLDAARREGGGPRAILERWLGRVKSAWGDLDARQRLVQQLPDENPQKRAVMRVMLIQHRLDDFREREAIRNLAPEQAEARRARQRAEYRDMVWERDFSHLDSGLHHFAALRGVKVATARGLALDVAERFHREVVRLHGSSLADVEYGPDGTQAVYDAKSQGERIVRHGGVKVFGAFRPSPGARHMVRISFYRAAGEVPGQDRHFVTLPLDFDPETVDLPKPKEPPRTYEAAPGSNNIAAFLLPYLHRAGPDREGWLKAQLGLVVARYCEAEGVHGVPGLDTPLPYGGSEIDRWCPTKRKWLIKPGVSLVSIDLVERMLTVQVAKGNGRRYVEMPITRLVSDFPKTTPVGDGIVRIDGAPGRPATYAAVGNNSDDEVDIARFDSLARARETFGLPALSDADLIGDDPWEGSLLESVMPPPGRSKPVSARQGSSASDYASASAALCSGLMG